MAESPVLQERADCATCGSAGSVPGDRCEVCDAPPDGAVDLPPAAPSPLSFLRLSDVEIVDSGQPA